MKLDTMKLCQKPLKKWQVIFLLFIFFKTYLPCDLPTWQVTFLGQRWALDSIHVFVFSLGCNDVFYNILRETFQALGSNVSRITQMEKQVIILKFELIVIKWCYGHQWWQWIINIISKIMYYNNIIKHVVYTLNIFSQILYTYFQVNH